MSAIRRFALVASAATACMAGVGGCTSNEVETGRGEVRPVLYPQAPTADPAPMMTEAPAPAATPAATPAPAQASTQNVSFVGQPIGGGAVRVEKVMPSEVVMGAPFEYQIIVTNLLNQDIENVVLTDTFSNNFELVSSDPQAQRGSGGVYTWNLGAMGANERQVITVQGRAGSGAQLNTCAEVTYQIPICAQANIVEPALRLAIAAPAEVCKCDPIPITITVTNPGTGVTRNVTVSHTLPRGLTTQDGQQTVSLAAGNLAPGQSRDFTVMAMADGRGNYSNTASANAAAGLEARSGTVNTKVTEPNLEITCSSPSSRFIGRGDSDRFSHRIRVSNTGDCAADNAMVQVSATDANIVSVSEGGTFSANGASFNLGTLAPGASRELEIFVDPSAPGTVTTTSTFSADCADTVTSSCDTAVEGIPAVLLAVVDLIDPVLVGGETTYVITVTNQGSALDRDITIRCELEEGVAFVSATGATAGSASGNSITFAPLPTLAPKQQAEWRVVVRGTSARDTRFSVRMDTGMRDRPATETEPTFIYE